MEKPERGLCQEWYRHPATKYILQYIQSAKLESRSRSLLGNSEFETISRVARIEGSVEALDDIEFEIHNIFSEGEDSD